MNHLEKENPLGYKKVSRLLTGYAIPSIIAMLVSALYNIVDQIFIGQGVGLLGNAATNVAFPLTTICTAIALLLGIGGASKFSLELGAGNKEEAAKAAGNSLSLMVIMGISLFLIVSIFLSPLLRFFGATADVFSYAETYTRITAFGMPFLILCNAASKLITADGSPRYSMTCMLSGAIINTILDPIFIFVFHMGIAGAAYATIIGQIVSCLIAVRYTLHFKCVTLTKESFLLNAACTRRICSLGASACFNQLAMTITQIVMNNVLTYYGARSIYGEDIPLACAGIIIKINMIFMAIVIGISQGTQPIVGYNYGAEKYGRVKEAYKLAAISATLVSVASFLCFQLFPRQIISIFGNGTEVYYQFSERYFRIFMFLTFINGIQPITANFFTSIGKPLLGIFMSMTRQIFFLLPLIVIFPLFMGIDGVMYAGPIADGAAAFLSILFLIREMHELTKKQLAKPVY